MAEMFRRRRLPHWEVDGAIYFVTACLAGSIPAEGLLDLDQYRETLKKRKRPEDVSLEDWETRLDKLAFARLDDWLDHRPAVRHFADAGLANLAIDTFRHFANTRYEHWAFVVMPSHIHWAFRPTEAFHQHCKSGDSKRTARERIMHSAKLHIATQANQWLGRTGTFWQDESYDHCIRDDEELGRVIEYIEMNPVRAGMSKTKEDFPFSSAAERAANVIPYVRPLLQ